MNNIGKFFNEISIGDISQIKTFIENGINVNEKDDSGQTALMVAVMNNRPEVVKLLLESKADVDAYGIEKLDPNPINFASANGLVDIVKILVEYNPNLKLLNVFNGTALIPACEQGHYEVAEILLECTDVDVNHVNNIGYTALYEITFHQNRPPIYEEIAKLLIKHGADVNIADKEGRTPLTIARKNGLQNIVNILEQNGGK